MLLSVHSLRSALLASSGDCLPAALTGHSLPGDSGDSLPRPSLDTPSMVTVVTVSTLPSLDASYLVTVVTVSTRPSLDASYLVTVVTSAGCECQCLMEIFWQRCC